MKVTPVLRVRLKKLIKDVFKKSPYAQVIEKLRIDNDVAFMVVEALNSLPNREKACLCLRYGITGSKMNRTETARVLGRVKYPKDAIGAARVAEITARGVSLRVDSPGCLRVAVTHPRTEVAFFFSTPSLIRLWEKVLRRKCSLFGCARDRVGGPIEPANWWGNLTRKMTLAD